MRACVVLPSSCNRRHRCRCGSSIGFRCRPSWRASPSGSRPSPSSCSTPRSSATGPGASRASRSTTSGWPSCCRISSSASRWRSWWPRCAVRATNSRRCAPRSWRRVRVATDLEREVFRYRTLAARRRHALSRCSRPPERSRARACGTSGSMPEWTHPTVIWVFLRNGIAWAIALRGHGARAGSAAPASRGSPIGRERRSLRSRALRAVRAPRAAQRARCGCCWRPGLR